MHGLTPSIEHARQVASLSDRGCGASNEICIVHDSYIVATLSL
jgi:hypothetical protein